MDITILPGSYGNITVSPNTVNISIASQGAQGPPGVIPTNPSFNSITLPDSPYGENGVITLQDRAIQVAYPGSTLEFVDFVSLLSDVVAVNIAQSFDSTQKAQARSNIGAEPVITAGTTGQYWRGDKSWQTLNQAAISGLTTADTPTFTSINIYNASGYSKLCIWDSGTSAYRYVRVQNGTLLFNGGSGEQNVVLDGPLSSSIYSIDPYAMRIPSNAWAPFGLTARELRYIGDVLYATTPSGSRNEVISAGGSYANPSWITSLAWSKVTGTPTTLAGYGITDAEPFVAAGTTAQYRRGDKTWATLNQAAVAGLTTSDSPAFTGATLAAGTITTSQPVSVTQTWNNAAVTFSGQTINITDTASNAASTAFKTQLAGTDKFSIRKDGYITQNTPGGVGFSLLGGQLTSDGYGTYSSQYSWWGSGNNNGIGTYAAGGLYCGSTAFISWTNGSAQYGTQDLYIYRGTSDTLEQRRSTNAQASRLYNTYTSGSGTNASNTIIGEWLATEWVSNAAWITTRKGSSGGTARDLVFGTDGIESFRISGVTRNFAFTVGKGIQSDYYTDQANNTAYIYTNTDSTHAWTLYNRTTTKVPLSVQGAASQTADLQQWQNSGGTTLASISSAGAFTTASTIGNSSGNFDMVVTGTLSNNFRVKDASGNVRLTLAMAGGTIDTPGGITVNGTSRNLGTSGLDLYGSDAIIWRGSSFGTQDLFVYRGGAGIVEQRNSTNAQVSRLYNTYTSGSGTNASNTIVGEWLATEWASNVAWITTRKGSSGGTARDLVLGTDGTERLRLTPAGITTLTVGDSSASAGTAVFTISNTKFGRSWWLDAANIWNCSAGGGIAMANNCIVSFNGGTAYIAQQAWSSNGTMTIGNRGNFSTGNILTIGPSSESSSYALTASSGVQRGVDIVPVINQSGTASYEGLRVNPTETALGSGASYLARFQVGGVDKCSITNGGVVTSTFQSLSSNPTTSDITSGMSRIVKNTTANEIRLWVNDGGTMKSSAALT